MTAIWYTIEESEFVIVGTAEIEDRKEVALEHDYIEIWINGGAVYGARRDENYEWFGID